MAWVFFHRFKLGQLDAAGQPGAPVDFDTDSVRILLITSAVNPASHVATWQDVTEMLSTASVAEVSGTNYARKTLSSVDATLSAGTITVDGSDPSVYSQSGSGFSDARYAILYKYNASDASAGVIAYYDLGSNKGNVSGDLTLQLSAAGLFTLA